MTISRLIAALQRSTHLKTSALRKEYPELFEISQEQKLYLLGFNTRLAARSIVAEVRGSACPIPHSQAIAFFKNRAY
jgi:hypothetical protein